VLLDINARLSSHLLPHRDSNGFRKLVLLLSGSGTPPPLPLPPFSVFGLLHSTRMIIKRQATAMQSIERHSDCPARCARSHIVL